MITILTLVCSLLLLFLASHLFLYYRFTQKCSKRDTKAFVNQLEEGDVVFICSKRPVFSSIFEFLVRPIVHAVFDTCYIHPVYISREPNTGFLNVFHWTGSNSYSAIHKNVCHSNRPEPNINIGDAAHFFKSHALNHGPIVSYKIYRKSSVTPLPQSIVITLGKQKCGVPAGLTRRRLQCFYFMLLLLQKLGYIDSQKDVYPYATPARAEAFLRINGFSLINEVTVCGNAGNTLY